MKLRQYQEAIVDEARRFMASGYRSVLIQSATGSGKTVLMAHMLRLAAEKGNRSIFCLHRRELIHQSMRAFTDEGIEYGIIANGFDSNPKPLVQIASIQSLARRLGKVKPPQFLVFDEAHHCCAKSWHSVYSAYPDAYKLGLTASPIRLDGRGLKHLFDVMVKGPSVEDLTDLGYLTPYRIFAPPTINVEGIHTRMGDYDKRELQERVDRPSVTGDVIREYIRHAKGKRCVCFCVSIKHSKHVVEQFRANGIASAHIDGDTRRETRDALVEQFRRGTIHVLTNVSLFDEGFDLPALEVVGLLRPTQSLGLYLQQVGRALRPFEGKEKALILDHAGNCTRHGLPDDDQEWTLEDRAKRQRSISETQIKVKVCPSCYAAQSAGPSHCRFCRTAFPIKHRKVSMRDGQLIELSRDALRNRLRREQGRANSFDELVELGRQRGYSRPYLWARHVFVARQRKKLGKR